MLASPDAAQTPPTPQNSDHESSSPSRLDADADSTSQTDERNKPGDEKLQGDDLLAMIEVST